MLSAPPPTRSIQDLMVQTTRFERMHDKFVRHLFGCPDKGYITEDVCNVNLGTINYAEYGKAREAAATLYDLKVPE